MKKCSKCDVIMDEYNNTIDDDLCDRCVNAVDGGAE